jgi:hypothetical protein
MATLERHNPGTADRKRRRGRPRPRPVRVARGARGELAGAVSQISDPAAPDEALDAIREQARQQVAEAEQTRGEAQAAALAEERDALPG